MVAIKVRTPPRFLSPGNGARVERDPMSVIEAAYDLHSPDEDWMAGVAGAMRPLLDQGLGIYGFVYTTSGGAFDFQTDLTVHLGCPPGLHEALQGATLLATPDEMLAIYTGAPCRSVSQTFTRLTGRPIVEFRAQCYLAEHIGVEDQLVVLASEADGSGCVFSGLAGREMRFPPRTAGVLSRVARHIAAARRLRGALAASRTRTLDVDAVLASNGAVLHAESDAKGKAVLQHLSSAARALSETRTRFRECDPERAVQLWRALVEGKWSLVDTEDTDGKRLLVARRNAPDLADPAALQPEERQVLALAARSHSLALITYELGLPAPTVSGRLARGLRKLGLRSRAELVRTFGVPRT